MKKPLFIPAVLLWILSLPLQASNVVLEEPVGYTQDGFDITLRAERVVNNDRLGWEAGKISMPLVETFGGCFVRG